MIKLNEQISRMREMMGLDERAEALRLTPEYLKGRIPFLKSFNDFSEPNWVHMQKVVYNSNVTWVMGDTAYKMKQLNTISEFNHTIDKLDSDRYRVSFNLKNDLAIMPEEGGMDDLLLRAVLYAIKAESEKLSYRYDEVQKTPDLPEEVLNKIINDINGAFFKFEDYITNHLQADIKNPLD